MFSVAAPKVKVTGDAVPLPPVSENKEMLSSPEVSQSPAEVSQSPPEVSQSPPEVPQAPPEVTIKSQAPAIVVNDSEPPSGPPKSPPPTTPVNIDRREYLDALEREAMALRKKEIDQRLRTKYLGLPVAIGDGDSSSLAIGNSSSNNGDSNKSDVCRYPRFGGPKPLPPPTPMEVDHEGPLTLDLPSTHQLSTTPQSIPSTSPTVRLKPQITPELEMSTVTPIVGSTVRLNPGNQVNDDRCAFDPFPLCIGNPIEGLNYYPKGFDPPPNLPGMNDLDFPTKVFASYIVDRMEGEMKKLSEEIQSSVETINEEQLALNNETLTMMRNVPLNQLDVAIKLMDTFGSEGIDVLYQLSMKLNDQTRFVKLLETGMRTGISYLQFIDNIIPNTAVMAHRVNEIIYSVLNNHTREAINIDHAIHGIDLTMEVDPEILKYLFAADLNITTSTPVSWRSRTSQMSVSSKKK